MKQTIKVLFAVAMLALLVLGYGSTWLGEPANAETAPQLRLRLFAEAQQRHSDVWAGCDQACVDARVQSAPFLVGLAKQANVSLDDLAKYAVVRSFEWGLNFESLYGRPPTIYDWANAYTFNAEALRYELAASPVIFQVDTWTENRHARMKFEYCSQGSKWQEVCY